MTDNLEVRESEVKVDFLSVLYELSAECIDSALVASCTDTESMAATASAVDGFYKNTPLVTFFVQSELRDTIIASINHNAVLRAYFYTLDHIFIQKAQSKLDIGYNSLVAKLFSYFNHLKDISRTDSVLNDNLYLEYKFDVAETLAIFERNSILFTIYCFKMAYIHSDVFSVNNSEDEKSA